MPILRTLVELLKSWEKDHHFNSMWNGLVCMESDHSSMIVSCQPIENSWFNWPHDNSIKKMKTCLNNNDTYICSIAELAIPIRWVCCLFNATTKCWACNEYYTSLSVHVVVVKELCRAIQIDFDNSLRLAFHSNVWMHTKRSTRNVITIRRFFTYL